MRIYAHKGIFHGEKNMSFGERLKKARFDKGLTQKELADKIGVRQTTVTRYEKNINFPSRSVLETIAKKLEIDADWLITGDSFNWKYRIDPSAVSKLIAQISVENKSEEIKHLRVPRIIKEMAKQRMKTDFQEKTNKDIEGTGIFHRLVFLETKNLELKKKIENLNEKIQELQNKLIEFLEKKR